MSDRKSKSSPPVIDFKPTNKDEEEYLRKLTTLLENKRRGDWGLVAELMECESQTAEKAFKRVYSKNHSEAVEALQKIINTRNELLKNKI
ncbi:hypothetical protein EGI11_03125 [Chryseobacterium sp. H3056]|uniref:Uncharacterized protein n=1 Tax=Kaistella daneshvariae TaxID=2487074 RepID=A0A3N0WXQ6_9FLAO|nr:hypothetical protein [Kaistella daneshvariae]ROI09763.1 hypothetical protein EGI11_03125 [Kaistella daneshvariae]